MQLYHFTSAYHLRGIGKWGLTVGDVPTDIDEFKGVIGVWLTKSPTPEGHGLTGSRVDKSRFRLTVDVPSDRRLFKWSNWARDNVPARTIKSLEAADGFMADEYYVYFGWLPPDRILEVVETRSGLNVENWGRLLPESVSLPGISYGRRHVWQRNMLRSVKAAMMSW